MILFPISLAVEDVDSYTLIAKMNILFSLQKKCFEQIFIILVYRNGYIFQVLQERQIDLQIYSPKFPLKTAALSSSFLINRYEFANKCSGCQTMKIYMWNCDRIVTPGFRCFTEVLDSCLFCQSSNLCFKKGSRVSFD